MKEEKNLQFEQKSKIFLVLLDSYLMIKRSSLHIIRNSDQLLGTFFQPIMFLVLFSAVFGGAISLALPKGISYLDFLMAGILIQTLAFGSTTTAIAITNDLKRGIVDRFKSLPMNEAAVINGHIISDLFRNGISTTVMLIVGFLLGLKVQASPFEWLLIVGMLLLFTFTFSWLMAIIGLLAKSVEGVQWLTFVLIFPLTFASSAFVPTEGMNEILKIFAKNQPLTHLIEALRALMLGLPVDDHLIISFLWCIAILVFAIPVAIALFRRKTNN